jgi:signal transduction histidine kinase
VVPEVADWCVVWLARADGRIETAAVAHADPARLAGARDWDERHPIDPAAAQGVARVIRTGQSELYERVGEAELRGAARSEEHLAELKRAGIGSALIVPIRTAERVVGAFTLINGEGRPRFGRDDVPLAEELARRAGVAFENARLFAEARAAEREARAAVAVRDEFISVASHELRTPLTTLRIQSESMERQLTRAPTPPTPDRLLIKVRSMIDQLGRLDRLIHALLDVSRISIGRLQLQLEPFDAAHLVRGVVERFGDVAAGAGSALELEALESAPGQWDRMRLEQVLANLLSNAIKYGGGRPVRVVLTASDEQLVLRVSDRGIGIAAHDHERIFERFERAASVHHFGGLGLGLWITREIVQAMGGRIGVESVLGEGATFVVTLPRRPAVR